MKTGNILYRYKKLFLSFLILISLLFSSCSWFSRPENEEENDCFVQLTGEISFGDIYKAASARSVFPSSISGSVNPVDFDYSITAVCTSTTKEDADALISVDDSVNPVSITYKLGLSGGTWKITANASKTSGGVTTVYYSASVENVEITSANSATVRNFTLLPPVESAGSVNLLLKADEDSGITHVKAEWTCDETKKSQLKAFSFSEGVGSAYFTMLDDTLNETSTKSGTYDVTFSFYDNEACSGVCLYQIINEKISVYDGLTSDKWTPSSAVMPEYLSGEGTDTFLVTKAMVDLFRVTTFYVDYTNGDNTTGAQSQGDFITPFQTIEGAVNYIIQNTTDTTLLYTIKIIGDYTATASFNNSVKYSFVYLPAITAEQSRKIKITSSGSAPVTINAKKYGRVFYIGDNNNITLENLIITGGYRCSSSTTSDSNYFGGGIFNRGNTTLLSSCVIGDETQTTCATSSSFSNYAYSGSAIFQESGVLNLYGPVIAYNYSNGQSIYSDYIYSGGALAIKGGTINTEEEGNLTQPYTRIQYNGSSQYGGGISLAGYSDSSYDEIIFSKMIIQNNSARNGGGIAAYNSSFAFKFKDVQISGNTATLYGGGIYLYASTLYLLEDVIVGDNTKTQVADSSSYSNTAPDGGGIFCKNNSDLKLYGATVSYNYASSASSSYGGGGICSYESTISFTDSTAETTPLNQISYNYCKYGGGICSKYASTTKLDNCSIYGNAANCGAGVLCYNTETYLGDGNTENGELIIGGDGTPDSANVAVTGSALYFWTESSTIYNLYMQNDAVIGQKDLEVSKTSYANKDGESATYGYGAIYFCYASNVKNLGFYIKGGTISGNLTTCSSKYSKYLYGAAFYINNTIVSVNLGSEEGATINITGNKSYYSSNDVWDSNIYIYSSTLKCSGKINNDSKIGIRTYDTPSETGTVFIENLYNMNPDISPSSVFIPDYGTECIIGWDDTIQNGKIAKKTSSGAIKAYQNVKFNIDRTVIRLNTGNEADRIFTVTAKAGVEDIECTNWKFSVKNRGVSAADTSSPAVFTTEDGNSNTITIPEDWFSDIYEIIVSAEYSNITFTGNFEVTCCNQIIPPQNVIANAKLPTIKMQLIPVIGLPLSCSGKTIQLLEISSSSVTFNWYKSTDGANWTLCASKSGTSTNCDVTVTEEFTYYCCGFSSNNNCIYTDVCTVFCSDVYNALGSIYYSDKTWSLEKDETKTPVGIVTALNEDGTPSRIISLTKTDTYYILSSSYILNLYQTLPFSFLDGEKDWEVILKYDPSAGYDDSAYPSFSWCNSYSAGNLDWYLPGIGEFQYIYNAYDLLKNALSKLNYSSTINSEYYRCTSGESINLNSGTGGIRIMESSPVYYSTSSVLAMAKVGE